MQKNNQSNNVLKKIKENSKLKSFELDVVPDFMEDEMETFSNDVDVDIDENDDHEQDTFIGFR